MTSRGIHVIGNYYSNILYRDTTFSIVIHNKIKTSVAIISGSTVVMPGIWKVNRNTLL
ncbi:hypothetical protein [Salinimicrobium marinum]|uniref:hypothetical protein n=1 Tax=Salinimicrobium marinum TaxID=680283 RepID=UPI00167B67F8|nr:hypothetical protein [Salinimicrobium marinum]